MRYCIGIEQKFVGIEAMASHRLIRTMHAIAVISARSNAGQVAVKNLIGVFRQRVASYLFRTS
jgi:hypothetical protein